MPAVSIVVPWRPGCPHREAALTWVLDRYRRDLPDSQVIVSEAPDGPWCKAAAVSAGVHKAAGDVLVVADADVWTDGLRAAAAVVGAGAGWVVPRCEVRRLSAASTAQVLAGSDPTLDLNLDQKPYGGVAAGGAVVLSRHAWETAPMDRRFVGWGQEDDAWAVALTGLVGRPVVLDWPAWPLWHLWHPPQQRHSRAVGSPEGAALARRYRTARNSPVRLRQLVEEGRPA